MTKQIKLDQRIAGSVLPDTVVTLTDDGTAIDATAYTWTVKAARSAAINTVLWTKTLGITAVGGTVTIAWAVADLGALTADMWVLDLIGTAAGSRPRKVRMILAIDDDVG